MSTDKGRCLYAREREIARFGDRSLSTYDAYREDRLRVNLLLLRPLVRIRHPESEILAQDNLASSQETVGGDR